MRFIAFALLAIAATSAEAKRKICEPGTQKKVDCNTCFCTNDGTGYGCTLMMCGEEKRSEVAVHPKPMINVCQPDEVMHDGCNICYCLGDGSGWVCTSKACLDSNPLLRSDASEPKQVCEPGSTKKMQCNNCFCIGDGSGWACSAMACPEYFNEDGSLKLPHEIANNPLLREAYDIEIVEERCEPGKEYKKYCNSCFCGLDGKSAGCTKMGCPPGLFSEDGSLRLPYSDNPLLRGSVTRKCEPGKSFKEYCNFCTCGLDGKSAGCTRMACPPGLFNEDGSLRLRYSDNPLLRGSVNRNCEPGKSFKEYCNFCFCGLDGKTAGCTKMACPPGLFNEDGSKRNPLLREKRETNENCEPGQSFKKYCNYCTCGPDGKKESAPCTRKGCPPGVFNEDGTLRLPYANNPLLREKSESKKKCEPGKEFKQYCNSCICGPEGNKDNSACTLQACPPGLFNEDGTLNIPTLNSNERFERSLDKKESKVCEPGESFMKDCNKCVCNDYGTDAACTLMLCPSSLLRNEENTVRVCQPGKKFKDDCNDCICNKFGTGAICTMQLCPPLLNGQRSPPEVCEPGRLFKQDCNHCRCNKDGTDAACMLMMCPSSLLRIKANAVKVCQPGKSFKKDCNDCVCNKDGTDAACTLRLCPPAL